MICVAGLASSALEGRIYNWKDLIEESPPHAAEKLKRANSIKSVVESFRPQKRHSITYCSIDALATKAPVTLHGLWLKLTTGRLKSGVEVPCTQSVPGIDVRPVQGMAGLRTLNPGEAIPVPVWKGLSDVIQDDLNLHAFNYDWRRWGDEVYVETMVDDFQATVEKFVSAHGPKAAVVGHSMGCPVILYCLSKLGSEWTKRYFDHCVLVAPAHMGSPRMIPSLAHGPVGATHAFIPAPPILSHDIADLCASWACMTAEMPVPCGGKLPWPEDYAFAFTPSKQYRLRDMGEFLEALAKNNSARNIPTAIWPGVERIYGEMMAPAVPLGIIYGDGCDTIAQVQYSSDNLQKPPEIKKNEPGDGTIVASSVEAVANAWLSEGAHVKLYKVPGAISHKDLIACPYTSKLLPKILAGEA